MHTTSKLDWGFSGISYFAFVTYAHLFQLDILASRCCSVLNLFFMYSRESSTNTMDLHLV